MQNQTSAESITELAAKILEKFDASVTDKFERCSQSEWCNSSSSEFSKTPSCSKHKSLKVASHLLCTKSAIVRRVAKKLVCMQDKLPKIKHVFKSTRGGQQPKLSFAAFDESITKGSNTPASSRPSSMSITADQIENLRGKQSPNLNVDGVDSNLVNQVSN